MPVKWELEARAHVPGHPKWPQAQLWVAGPKPLTIQAVESTEVFPSPTMSITSQVTLTTSG